MYGRLSTTSSCVECAAGALGKSTNSTARRTTPVEGAAQSGNGNPAVTVSYEPLGLQSAVKITGLPPAPATYT